MDRSPPASAPAPCVAESTDSYPGTLPLALLAFHRAVGKIVKASDAKYGRYADLPTVLDAVMPALLDAGLVPSQTIQASVSGDVLRTSIVHGPTGESISSEWALPTLRQLLDNQHALRETALQTFPIDLTAVPAPPAPMALPPRASAAVPPAPASASSVPEPLASEAGDGAQPQPTQAPKAPPLPPSPPRAAGVRLEDQIKGLYTVLGQLGTTTNPLHSLGGAITYMRRYALLAILSLSAEDDDGEAFGPADPAVPRSTRATSRQSPAIQAGEPAESHAAPRPRTTRSRAARTAEPAVPSPATGNGNGNGSGAQAASPSTPPAAASGGANGQHPAPPAAPPPLVAAELSGAEVQALITEISAIGQPNIPPLIAAFRTKFRLPDGARVSDYIATRDHAAFITDYIAQLPQSAPV
ncbi:ERF family protein [Synechococcus sp. Cruz-9H2]|uniref:ERF family protein n=1 Tax=unclassified Synechococcus TaxID=2626047 RepID=UPI0020CCCCD4|nr:MULTISPECIES: ERF family protein [unclassified Synechococcus]MCP9819833.1 ERF family protein [Synechococcus sp. Cruz-9H2]MCP9844101.1 ERF family protein [Synechococcus sp. Edmonson 11F2]MCP9856263.1 ERF family protein [Synechococcus sp. Cruz-9C9]MCP9863548.1 ERF family protein [Synechococcus sp. Cruz-7E5]MCP9870744.1 ERF family protein [Synechococcus sp. Cruz-7B9]